MIVLGSYVHKPPWLHACEQALSVVSALLPGGPSVDESRVQAGLELAAQLQYRLGRSKECIQLYDSLFHQHKVGTVLHCCHQCTGESREYCMYELGVL